MGESFECTEKKDSEIKCQIKNLMNEIHQSRFNEAQPNMCSRNVRKILYNFYGNQGNILNIKGPVGNASHLYRMSEEVEQNIATMLENTLQKIDGIYDISVKEHKINTDKLVYHRVFFIVEGDNIFTIDPYYDDDQSLKISNIITLTEWKKYFFKQNKQNATFKILQHNSFSNLKK